MRGRERGASLSAQRPWLRTLHRRARPHVDGAKPFLRLLTKRRRARGERCSERNRLANRGEVLERVRDVELLKHEREGRVVAANALDRRLEVQKAALQVANE